LKYYPPKAGLTPRNKCEQVGLQQDWQKLAGRQETKMMQESEMGLWTGRAGESSGSAAKFQIKKESVSLFLSIMICVCLIGQVSNSSAQYFDLKDTISAYELYAFPTPGSHLVRPSSQKPTNVYFHCSAEYQCNDKISLLNRYLKARWLTAVKVSQFDSEHMLSVEFVDGASENSIQPKDDPIENLHFPVGKNEKVFVGGKTNCKSVSVVLNKEITMISVIANSLASDRLTMSCVISGLARAAGLNFPTFEQLWAPNGQLTTASDEDYNRFMLGAARLIAIQTSPLTRAGMNQAEFEYAISGKSIQDLMGE
jgi:hypothetical protein